MASPKPSSPGASSDSKPIPSSPKNPSLKNIFIGVDGMRSGWRVLLFYSVLGLFISSSVLAIRAIRGLLSSPHPATHVLSPGWGLANEGIFLIGVLFTSAIFARFEKRSFADYGLPGRGAFVARFLEGLLWGVVLMSRVLLVLRASGNFYFGSIDLTSEKIATFAVLWALFFAMVGVAEGFAFSGYPLFALARGMGFWPARHSWLSSSGVFTLRSTRERTGWVQ